MSKFNVSKQEEKRKLAAVIALIEATEEITLAFIETGCLHLTAFNHIYSNREFTDGYVKIFP